MEVCVYIGCAAAFIGAVFAVSLYIKLVHIEERLERMRLEILKSSADLNKKTEELLTRERHLISEGFASLNENVTRGVMNASDRD